MAKLAQYDNTLSQPTPVNGWFNTDQYTYASPPSNDSVVTLTEDQWNAHFDDPNAWGVLDGALVSYTAPVQNFTIAQQASILAAGSPTITVTCTSLPVVNGTYLIDNTSQTYITGVVASINAGLGLPSGEGVFYYPDTSGALHQWLPDQFVAFGFGVMQYLYNLNQVAFGNGTVLPDPTLTLA